MRSDLLAAAFASLMIGLPAHGFGQSQPARDQSFTHGESARCESLTGAAKEQCDREEATKTQGPQAQESSPAAAAAGSGSFTHGESKRCETLSGAAKEQCDKEEATKTQGEQARDLANPPRKD